MATTADERETIRRLRHLHGKQPKDLYRLFPKIPKRSLRRISEQEPEPPTPQYIPPPPDTEPQQKQQTTITQTNDGITLDHTAALNRVITLEDLIEVAQIDLEEYKVERWTANTWESAMKNLQGHPIITTLYQVKANLIPHKAKLSRLIIEQMREELRRHTYRPEPMHYSKSNSHNMLELSLPDMHFGQITHKEETGLDWDIDTAEKLYKKALSILVNQATSDQPERILFPVGNDLLNIDNPQLATTKGTVQDNTTSLLLLFKKVKNILKNTILDLRQIAPVEIVCVPGNHDRTMSYLIVDALEDIFTHDKHVKVRNHIHPRTYVQWGANLVGFTHGDQERHASLPGIMAHEAKDLWAASEWHEWHVGHKHRAKQQHFLPTVTHDGVIIRTIPSLTTADKWHTEKGYTAGNRTAEAYVWNATEGMTAIYKTSVMKNGQLT